MPLGLPTPDGLTDGSGLRSAMFFLGGQAQRGQRIRAARGRVVRRPTTGRSALAGQMRQSAFSRNKEVTMNLAATQKTIRPFNGDILVRAKRNTFFREVVSTGPHAQVVVMSIPPAGEIGEEVHNDVDQVLVFVEG